MLTELATKETIYSYIPQRDPILLVHCIYECTDTTSKCGFTIDPTHIFVENGKLTEPGIVENMAQSVAAHAGFLTFKSGEAPKLGFIANIKHLHIYQLPAVNSEVITEVTVKSQVMNFTLIDAASSVNGVPVASCEMKIFLQE